MIFLSYAREDRAVALGLATALRANAESIVMDPPLPQSDPFWRTRVRLVMNRCDRMIVLWSMAAWASPWVDQETRAFRGRVEYINATDFASGQTPVEADELPLAERSRLLLFEEARLEEVRRAFSSRHSPRLPSRLGRVSNADYAAFIRSCGYQPPPTWSDPTLRRAELAVTGITWYEAQAYAAWVGGELPTEEEWAKEARHFGDIWEWTATPTGAHRVIRGGSTLDSPRFRGRAARYRNAPIDRDCVVGFSIKIPSRPNRKDRNVRR